MSEPLNTVNHFTDPDYEIKRSKFLLQLQEEGYFTDCTLSMKNGVQIKAHRAVLAMQSEYFVDLFKSQKDHAYILMPDTEAEIMSAALKYMYTGNCKVRYEDHAAFIALANTFKINGLNLTIKEEEPLEPAYQQAETLLPTEIITENNGFISPEYENSPELKSDDDLISGKNELPNETLTKDVTGDKKKYKMRSYKQYSRYDLDCALQFYRQGKKSVMQLSREFGVPTRTLYANIKKLNLGNIRPSRRGFKASSEIAGNNPQTSHMSMPSVAFNHFAMPQNLLMSLMPGAGILPASGPNP